MSHWRRWATTALEKMSSPDWVPVREEDLAEIEAARAALEQTARTGFEPYYTLKAFVCLNNLEGRPSQKREP